MTAVITRVILEWLDGAEAGRRQDVPEGAIVFGRGESANVFIASAAISRAHARLIVEGGLVVLQDLDSANGTRVNGQPLKGRIELKHGDELMLGDARRFRVHVETSGPIEVIPGQTLLETVEPGRSNQEPQRTRLLDPRALAGFVTPAAVAALEDVGATRRVESVVAPDLRRITGVRLAGAVGTFTLARGRSIVGRGADAAVRVDSRELSRVHAAIVVSATEAVIEDLGSANGTRVNGEVQAGRCRLAAGDRLAFGSIEFVVELIYSMR